MVQPAYAQPEYAQPPPGGYPPPVVESMPAGTEVGYGGPHPIPEQFGGGWCMIAGPHLHPYGPQCYDQYVLRDNYFYFGEGVAEFLYSGAHPVPPEFGGGWCNIPGYHRHPYRPWAGYWYDPGARVYVYNPQRARVVTVEVVRPGPSYRAPPVVVERSRMTPVVRGGPAPVVNAPMNNVARPMQPAPQTVRTAPVYEPPRPMAPASAPRPAPVYEPPRPMAPPPVARPAPVYAPPRSMTPPVSARPIAPVAQPPRAAPPKPAPPPPPRKKKPDEK
jgi:hypothetical protein